MNNSLLNEINRINSHQQLVDSIENNYKNNLVRVLEQLSLLDNKFTTIEFSVHYNSATMVASLNVFLFRDHLDQFYFSDEDGSMMEHENMFHLLSDLKISFSLFEACLIDKLSSIL